MKMYAHKNDGLEQGLALGGATIVNPSRSIDQDPDEITDKYIEERALSKAKAIHPETVEITEADLPLRDFRNAWRFIAGKIEVDMPKARLIHMDKIRAERNKKLTQLDKDWMKAMGQGGDAVSIENERQILRDIPQTFDLEIYPNPTALKAAWPVEL